MKERPIRRIAIIGGTHGNENNGKFLIDSYRRHGEEELQRPSFERVQLITGNPAASARVVRFLDQDLNRSFSVESLRDLDNPNYEAARAKALNAMLGPKPGSLDAPGTPLPTGDEADSRAVDFLIDLHTTTTNMGCCLMVNHGVSLYVATYARAWLDHKGIPAKICLTPNVGLGRASKTNVGSVAHHNIVIECGPTPTGLVRHDIVMWMREATQRVLDCLDCLNRGISLQLPPPNSWGNDWVVGAARSGMPEQVVVNYFAVDRATGDAKIPVPSDINGSPTTMFAPGLQDKDFKALRKGDPIFVDFNGHVIRYDGNFGDVVYPIFVNESGYYFASSGLGFMLTIEKQVLLDCPMIDTDRQAPDASDGSKVFSRL